MTTQITLPPNTRTQGQGNPAPDIDQVITALMAMTATSWVTPSGDTTGVTDPANIGAAFTANGACLMQPGLYYTNAPIPVPDQNALISWNPSWGIPTGNYGAGSLPLQGAIIQAVSGFSGGQILSIGSAGAVQHGGQRIQGITLDGSQLPNGNTVNGIESVGFVGGVKITDVVVSGSFVTASHGLGGHGLYAHNDGTGGHNPDFWQVTRSKFSGCGGYGIELIAMSDSWFTDSEATGNFTGGGNIQNCGETRFTSFRFNNNATTGTTPGLSYTALTGFTGEVVFTACDMSANGIGILVAGSGTGTMVLNGCVATGNTTQWSYSGTAVIHSSAAWNTSTAAPTLS